MNFIDATRYYWSSRDCDDLEKFEREYWAWRYSEYFEFDLLANNDNKLDMISSPIDTFIWDHPEQKKEMRKLQKEIKRTEFLLQEEY